MKSGKRAPASVSAYIAASAPPARSILKKIRQVARKAAPDAEEVISYRMPALKQGKILIYFAAFKSHIGLFPPVRGDAAIERALKRYRGPKGNLRFPIAEPIPYALIGRIVRLRVRQTRSAIGSPRQN